MPIPTNLDIVSVSYNGTSIPVSGGGTSLQSKSETYTPTTSQQTDTITADSGYDGLSSVEITVGAMPTGSAGTPTATKGTVSGNAISVTPSVTNTTGYITGGTKTGTAVSVSASELVSGSVSITSNGTVDVTNYASAVVNVPSSSPSLGTKSITANGTYTASDDGYDGYSAVTVNVSGGGSVLPSGYTEREKVTLTGSQYIDTGFVPVQYDVIRVKFQPNGLSSSGIALYSAGTSTYQLIMLFYSDNTFYKYLASGSAPNIQPMLNANNIYEVIAGQGVIATTGTYPSYATSNYGGTCNTNLFIGKRANNSSYFKGDIYSFSVENCGTKKIDLIPCTRDSDSVVGFYDLVSESFMPSAGGSFT